MPYIYCINKKDASIQREIKMIIESSQNIIGHVNSHVPKTVRHGTSFHIICPKLLIDSSPSRLYSQTPVRQSTVKLFGSSPIQLESQASVRQPLLKLFCLSPSHLSFDRHRNCWLTYQPSVLWPSQPLTTHVLDICPLPVTETKMLPIVCTAQI